MVERLGSGNAESGTIHVDPVTTWVSQTAFDA